MKAAIIVSLLVAVAVAKPHDFAGHANHPSEIIRRNKALLRHTTTDDLKKSTLLRVATTPHHLHNGDAVTPLGAPVTFVVYSDNTAEDFSCSTTPKLARKMHVGKCLDISPGFAVNITNWVQPPIHGNDPEGLCASLEHYDDDNCQTNKAVMNFQCKACQDGRFWADCGGVYGALFMHTSCNTPSVTDFTCGSCNTTTITSFNQCKAIPNEGSIKAIKLEKCNTVRLNLLTGCNNGTIYDSYPIAQDMCYAGMMVKDGHN